MLLAQDFFPKLETHIFSQILDDMDKCNGGRLIFKNDCIYPHSLLRVNYTTYDVRRDQDTINVASSHCNMMILSGSDSSQSPMYRYARVHGTYHANIIFVGQGIVDYNAIRIEFLWVQWYKQVDCTHTGWVAQKLDRLRFPPMANDDSFGFLDPADVLCGCHILPVFSKGRVHSDGKGMSFHAKDARDWVEYYVNRYVACSRFQ